ncbi:cation/multidrug efflux pump [Terriglobus roseus DSM 18391]|uniref:Cation/multidrug efflux pump n=1 Tax=Terriglobus roseus (strain DSM 18391 / NRRL B-41598 / KBS 63) TaxID=926566 RepID=I3ZID6_TERRK|nr:efflux RND transporter permease subunit [Terriglobus roseus]AFL89004.1 cation/multidrug efflux pump [Terriglobus roseus DSM 18391]
MWIVRLALRRPYTFVVMAVLILVLGVVSIETMSTDIFPSIDIPVVTVIWQYNGTSPDEMEKRFTTISERAMTTTVNDIEHIESQSVSGISVIKIFFQPGVKIEAAVAQVTAVNQTILRVLPTGTTPPFILQFSASNVPILQAVMSSDRLSETDLYDLGAQFVRTQLATVQGAQVPNPYGGKARQVSVDLDPGAMQAKGVSPSDVVTALTAQNLILPAGDARIGDRDYLVRTNASPLIAAQLNDIPIKQVNGATIYMRDVAQVHEGSAVQLSIVRADGRRAVLLTILKASSASTLDIVKRVKAVLPKILANLPPPAPDIKILFDQSIFVQAALTGVVKEAAIAAGLTAVMILLFLGSWRSTVIIAVSIPLSILVSIIIMKALGQTLNTMTLGGLGLAVGILVDDATVEIENIHRNLGLGKEIEPAILDGAAQIAVPAFVSTLAICIVFVPVVFLSGAARSLFTPLGMAVVFAMMASYFLSRTLVPTMVKFLLAAEVEVYALAEAEHGDHPLTPTEKAEIEEKRRGLGAIWRTHFAFNRVFEAIRARYQRFLDWALAHTTFTLGCFGLFILISFCTIPFIGRDFFPDVDAGSFRLHVRCPPGTRLERTEEIFGQVDQTIRDIIPKEELGGILDNMGVPQGFNLAFGDGSLTDVQDGEILVSLNAEHHKPTAGYRAKLREVLRKKFPEEVFYFQASDIVNQILNFGLPAPIDIQISGRLAQANYATAQQIAKAVSQVPGAVDVHVHQIMYAPELRVNVDRTRAQQVNLTEASVANSMLTALSGSGQAAPNYWLNPTNGVNYQVVVQVPLSQINSVASLNSLPITSGVSTGTPPQFNGGTPTPSNTQLLSNLAQIQHSASPGITNHYNVQPVYDVFVNKQGRDLGAVATDVNKVLKSFEPKLSKGATMTVRGQVKSMQDSFTGLGLGMIFAVLLVYLLMVINFQSWLDPFIILMALPGAACGILWMLFLTGTTFSVPSLMGAIMTVGVATANSILMVTFANDQRSLGLNSLQAASAAGFTRLRPVMMTALAMILGMLPMSLGMGEGGEQNAPLGRAVIGGLLVATATTLVIVPIFYSLLRKAPPLGMQVDANTEQEEYFEHA